MSDISRRTLLRWSVAAGALASGATALTACSGGPGGSGPAATSGAVDINLWTHDKGYSSYFAFMAKSFNEAKSTPFAYTVTPTIYTAPDIITKMLAAASANRTTPDMVGLEIGSFPRLMTKNLAGQLLETWDERIAAVKDDLISSRLAPYSVDGKVYAIESSASIVVYYYREDLFSQYSIPNSSTWEEFAEFGASFHAQTGKSLVPIITGPDNGSVSGGFLQFLLQRGGGYFNEAGELTIDTQEVRDVITFITDGLKSGFMVGVDNLFGGPVQAGYKSESIIGIPGADWYKTYGLMTTVPEQAGKWRIRPLPKFAAGGYGGSVSGGTGFTALKDHANTTATMDLIANSYLTVEGQLQRFKQIGYLPTLKSVYEQPDLVNYQDEYLGGQKIMDTYGPLASDLPPQYQSPNGAVLGDVLGGPLLKAYSGQMDADTVISTATAAYKQQAQA